jgi:peptidoglycan/LPS O-acetylase OafA/YrhL
MRSCASDPDLRPLKGSQRSMSVPQAPDSAFDTLIVEPVPPISGAGDGDRTPPPDSLSVITTDPVTGRTTETTLASIAQDAAPNQLVLEVRKRFTELDGLRGAAALLVVVFHLRKYVKDLDPPHQLYQLISGAYLMVDLFFVLSGFVLARSMLATRTRQDVFRFSNLRARRFLPLHLTGMLIAFLCVLLTFITQQAGYAHAPGRDAFTIPSESPWGYLSAVLLLQGLIGPHFAGYAAAWSLSIELWMNILLVVAIAAIPWAHRKQWVGPGAVTLGTLVLFTVGLEGENSVGWTAIGRGLTGLGTGMVVYWAYTSAVRRGVGSATGTHRLAGHSPRAVPADLADQAGPAGTIPMGIPIRITIPVERAAGGYRPARWPAIGAVLGLLALLGCVYFAKDIRPLQFIPVFLVSAGLIFCLVQPSDGPAHRLLNSRIVQWLGSRSFALYALHASVLLTVSLSARLAGLNTHRPKVAVCVIVFTLVGALAASEVGHRFIERLWVPKKSK